MRKSFRNSIFSIPEVDILDLQEFVRVNNKSCIEILRDLAIPQKGGTTSLHVSTYRRYCRSAVRLMRNCIDIIVDIQFFRVRGTQY